MRKPRKTLSFNIEEFEGLRNAVLKTYGTDNYLFDKIDNALSVVLKKQKIYLDDRRIKSRQEVDQ